MKFKDILQTKEKSDKELATLNDKNLLAYYKAERQRHFEVVAHYTCDCCGEIVEQLSLANSHIQPRHEYLAKLKSLLATRGHVQKTHNPKK